MILTTKNELNFFCVKTYPVILTLCCQTHVTYDTVEELVNNTPTLMIKFKLETITTLLKENRAVNPLICISE